MSLSNQGINGCRNPFGFYFGQECDLVLIRRQNKIKGIDCKDRDFHMSFDVFPDTKSLDGKIVIESVTHS